MISKEKLRQWIRDVRESRKESRSLVGEGVLGTVDILEDALNRGVLDA